MSEGSTNPKLRRLTRMIMDKSKENIEERGEASLTVGQYNSVFEAIQDVLDGNI